MNTPTTTRIAGNIPSKGHLSTFLTHVLGVCILFILPEVLLSISDHDFDSGHNYRVYIKAAIYVAVFYINYHVITDRTLGRRVNLPRFFLYNLILTCVALGALQYLTGSATHLFRNFVMIVLTMSLSAAIKITYKWIELDIRVKDDISRRREEELKQLKAQIHPHFLFNTLNSIYALIDIAPDTARDAVHRLSSMMRYMIYENPRFVTLQQETEFTAHYIQLMRLRLTEGARLDVTLDSSQCPERRMPPLIFINLIENVFKHGQPDHPMRISLTAEPDGTVTCTTFNHMAANVTAHRSHRPSSGIGLTNLRRRLELIYGSDAGLATESDGRTFTARLTIKPTNENG
ncbi:MAG: sensor histidine kinase [Muribaculaceae bacterium]|nr:sensor histidine kinase [Muribaculaceae bacterium]